MNKGLMKTIEQNGYQVEGALSQDTFGRYHGILRDSEGTKYFMKALAKSSNYVYKSLFNEIKVTEYLSNKTESTVITHNNYRLRIPPTKKIIDSRNHLCLISNYVEGVKLIGKTPEEQTNILITTLELIDKLGKNFDFKDIEPFLKNYSGVSLFFTTPVRLLKALILTPTAGKKIFTAALKIFPIIKSSLKKQLVHADINSTNIIVSGNDLYLTDWEEAGLGLPQFNTIAPLSIYWTNEIIRDSLLNKFNIEKTSMEPLLAYRTLVLFNQDINFDDARRKRDMLLLDYISSI